MSDIESIDGVLGLNRDETLLAIGARLGSKGMSAQHDREELVARAKKWMERNRESLRKAICSDELVQAAREFPERKRALILIIADTVSQIHIGVPCFHIANLLILDGLDALCGKLE